MCDSHHKLFELDAFWRRRLRHRRHLDACVSTHYLFCADLDPDGRRTQGAQNEEGQSQSAGYDRRCCSLAGSLVQDLGAALLRRDVDGWSGRESRRRRRTCVIAVSNNVDGMAKKDCLPRGSLGSALPVVLQVADAVQGQWPGVGETWRKLLNRKS